jgi:hypothetical protein
MQMLFFLRYRSQLRRTRPELIAELENSVVGICKSAGGIVKQGRRLFLISFDESALAFRLDVLIALEGILQNLKKNQRELYGFTLLLGPETDEDGYERLCRLLSEGGGNVWFGPRAREEMSPYVYFEKNGRREGRAAFAETTREYVRLKGIRTFQHEGGVSPLQGAPLQEAVLRALGQGAPRSAILLGPEFLGKREGLARYCGELLGAEFPPLVFRFGTGGRGLCSIADAFSPRIRSVFQKSAPKAALDELDGLEELLFRERLRDELSGYVLGKGRRFLSLLLEIYAAEAKRRRLPAVIVLENIHRAEEKAAVFFMDTFDAFPGRGIFLLYATAADNARGTGEVLKLWERIFPRLIRLNAEGHKNPVVSELPPDLWEIGFALQLLCGCFPGILFEQLFEEEGKNRAMISRAFSLLVHFGMIDTPLDPRPRMNRFTEKAEKFLGGGAEKVRALVRNRLLDWVSRNRLSPCFRLLEFLADLGAAAGARSDELVLRSISADLINGTDEGLGHAVSTGKLEKIAGPERIETLVYIIKTKRALLRGGEADIRNAFLEPPPEPYAPYKVQILTNLAGFQLGIWDAASAMETVKEAILLSQDKPWTGLAQAYRLFSLVNLVKQQVSETIDYASFAVENAEKTGNYDELGIASYYAAAAQFLYGNISKAERLAAEAEKQAEWTGRPEWADRARFLRGKFRFETGHYRDALDIFESLRKREACSPEMERLIAAWIYRVKIYSQSPLIQKPADGGTDADLFEIEAAYLAENFRHTEELCRRFSAPAESFIFTEQPDWRSGFAQCELFLLSPSDFWNRIISVYHSLALCKLSPSGAEEAVHTMRRILREEGLSDMDPNDAFYLYAFYRILQDSGSPQVDMNTAVSMGFKRLQKRASRIDDIEVRRDFLSLPRWNNALSLAARDYKLI